MAATDAESSNKLDSSASASPVGIVTNAEISEAEKNHLQRSL